MIDEKEILPFNFFDYNGVYSGSNGGMRYIIKRTGKKPDFNLQAAVWPGPYCFEGTDESDKTYKEFTFSEAGRSEAISWIKEQYETRKEEWDKVPSILDAVLKSDIWSIVTHFLKAHICRMHTVI